MSKVRSGFLLTPVAAALSMVFTTAALAQSSGVVLDDVVITAQKRTEKIADTPVAASVVSEKALEDANVSDIVDLNKLVPSVELKGTFNGRVPLAIRGISTNANEGAIGLTSGVAIQVDGIPIPSDAFGANELSDIVGVEVLKGPQSTLGGRTASAGVINILTQKPTSTFQGNMGATLTNDGERRLNGTVSGPISESLLYSLSAYGNERQYPILNLDNGQHSKSRSDGFRGKLQLIVDRDTDVTLFGRVANSNSTGTTFTYQYLTPGALLFPYLPWNTAGFNRSQSFPGVNIGFGNTNYYSPVAMNQKVHSTDVGVTVERRFQDFTLTYTGASQKERSDSVQDVTDQAVYFLNTAPFTPPFYNQSFLTTQPKSTTHELKITSPTDQFMSYVAGIFYSDVNVVLDTKRAMFVNPDNTHVTSDTKSTALYGRATWNLTPSTSLLTGLRFNQDAIAYTNYSFDSNSGSAASDTSHTTVGDLTLRQKLDANSMVYGTLSKGYKPRAYNTAVTPSSTTLTPAGKEDIQHFELGGKSTLLDGRMQLNVALFDTTYNNYQVQIYPPGQIIPVLELMNAAKARTTGLEVDSVYALTNKTKFTTALAVMDARFVNFNNAPAFPGQTAAQGATGLTQNLSGKPMPDAPKLKLTLGVDHNVGADVLLPWPLRLNATYAYRTSANFQADQNPYAQQGALGILNLSATASLPSGNDTVTLFVNNVTNKFYLVNAEDFFSGLYSASGGANAVVGQPARDAARYFGVRYNHYF
jgi:iron complex outermembrane receptor protein